MIHHKENNPIYIGDGVYLEYLGYGYRLYTERFERADETVDEIFLDEDMIQMIVDYKNGTEKAGK